jgi:hypothetical protein
LAGVFNGVWDRTAPPAVRLYGKIGFAWERVMELNDPKGVYAYCLICDTN